MLTITKLAKQFGLSRATILYYEKIGLLEPANRSSNEYRWYGEKEQQRLEQIQAYRSFGMPLDDVKMLLNTAESGIRDHLLLKQFANLDQAIQSLRLQQNAILQLIEQKDIQENTMISKQRWVEIMQAAGLSEENMINWHKQFERLEPDAHQEFLVSLGIDDDEITKIRTWSQQA